MKRQSLAIYDNGGRTTDRYTVIIDRGVFGMSENAQSPSGYNQFCMEVEQLSPKFVKTQKKVIFDDLPEEVQKAILERMTL